MNRKARRRAIWFLERRRLLRGVGAFVDFAAPAAAVTLDDRAAGRSRGSRLGMPRSEQGGREAHGDWDAVG